jgi:pimeloyl-ACP methyl ester carboxylesterase
MPEHDGWIVSERGPQDAARSVLLLPGGLCSSVWFDDLIVVPSLESLRFVATTLPGFGGTPPLADVGIENYANGAARLAADRRCDVVVGHSMGGNVALEMAASGAFSGPVVLVSPSFSRQDEMALLSVLDKLAHRGLGSLPFSFMLMMVGPVTKKELPPGRRDALLADLKNNDPRFMRREMRAYLEYLDRHGSLAGRLCESGVPAWVGFGDHGDVGLTDEERQVLEDCPSVTLVTIQGAGHASLVQKPERIAELVLASVSSLPA